MTIQHTGLGTAASAKAGHKYRPEIDGMRAVAVMGVLIYHADLMIMGRSLLPGGFLGVDVFFVLSGYLLTSVISKQHLAGTFRFRTFYFNRVKRLLPALFTVFLGTMPLALALLSLEPAREFANSVIAAVFSVSNIFFWMQDSYTAEPSKLKPMLHTWTLAVEEQFYLIVPWLLVAAFSLSRRLPMILFSALLIASFIAALIVGQSHPTANFFLLPTRFWELAAGSVLALLQIQRNARGQDSLLSDILCWIGLAMIAVSFVIFYDDANHPGWITLVPVIGTCLLIWFTAPGRTSHGLLSTRGFVWIGLISYSLYLWHWPLIVFARIHNNGVLSAEWALSALALSFVLSAITYTLIEKPFRRRFSVGRVWAYVVVTAIATLALCAVLLARNGMFPGQNTSPSEQSVPLSAGVDSEPLEMSRTAVLARSQPQYLELDGRRCIGRMAEIPGCVFNYRDNAQSGGNFVLIGDSHAAFMLGMSFHKYIERQDGALTILSPNACPFFGRHIEVTREDVPGPGCTIYQEQTLDWMVQQPPMTIVISSRYALYLNGTRFDNEEGGIEPDKEIPSVSVKTDSGYETLKDAYAASIQELTEAGHTVVLIYPVPEVGANVRQFYARASELRTNETGDAFAERFRSIELTTSYGVYKRRAAPAVEMLDAVSSSGDGQVVRIYPDQLFCSEETGRCRTRNETDIFYFDDDHVSEPGADIIVRAVLEAVQD